MKSYIIPTLEIDALLSEVALSMVHYQMQKAGNQLEKIAKQRANLMIEVSKGAKGYFNAEQQKRFDELAKREAKIQAQLQELYTEKAQLLYMIERPDINKVEKQKSTRVKRTEKEALDEIRKIRKETQKGNDLEQSPEH